MSGSDDKSFVALVREDHTSFVALVREDHTSLVLMTPPRGVSHTLLHRDRYIQAGMGGGNERALDGCLVSL